MVIGLNFGSSPTAVARLIIAIIVYAVYAQSLWSWSHVSQEVLELLPSLANLNPAPAIAAPFFRFGIFTAEMHCVPNAIFRGLFACSSMAMFKSHLSTQAPFSRQASTTPRITYSQARAKDIFNVSARALTFPYSLSVLVYGMEG